ncbi:hypothetical protein VNI00_015577 [Paramarasmius palmivorus]|uniref:Uncharacterized protein n=1 Tax=Paramarasmius palmivorus TaxID=297713 RepID=A0AAW0BJC6_9AGAR
MSLYREQRYDLQGADEIDFLKGKGHNEKEIYEILIPIRKKGRRRNREAKREQFCLRSAAQRAKIASLDAPERDYHKRKKQMQQREWRERNREKLAEKAKERRRKIKAMDIPDYDPNSPLPPSDPPSPASSDDIFNDTTLLQARFSPKLPTNWRQFNTAHQYKPARALFREWISPQTSRISSVVQGPRIKTSKSRVTPILYSFQKKEYQELDNTEAMRFMDVTKKLVSNDEPEREEHAKDALTSSQFRMASGSMSSPPTSLLQKAIVSKTRMEVSPSQSKPTEYLGDLPVHAIHKSLPATKRDSARTNARNYYNRNRAKVLAKAAQYRERKRIQLHSCGTEELEKQLEERRRKQRLYSCRFREKHRI